MNRIAAAAAAALVVASGLAALQAQEPKGPREGITVHGHWVIDVRNPDGTLVSHRDFENALFADGPKLLAGLLTHSKSMGFWIIQLYGDSASPCGSHTAGGTIRPNPCQVVEPALNGSSSFVTSRNLVVSAGGAGDTVTLTGSVQASTVGSLTRVETQALACEAGPTLPWCDIPSTQSYPFTSATIAPIAVAANQIIQVTVTFSFS